MESIGRAKRRTANGTFRAGYLHGYLEVIDGVPKPVEPDSLRRGVEILCLCNKCGTIVRIRPYILLGKKTAMSCGCAYKKPKAILPVPNRYRLVQRRPDLGRHIAEIICKKCGKRQTVDLAKEHARKFKNKGCPICWKAYEYNGKHYTIQDLMKITGLSKPGVSFRLSNGESIGKLLETGRLNAKAKLTLQQLIEGKLTPNGKFFVVKKEHSRIGVKVLHLVKCTRCGRQHLLDVRALGRCRKGCRVCAHDIPIKVAGEALSLRELCELFDIARCSLPNSGKQILAAALTSSARKFNRMLST
jgi:hypothetical protein